MARVLLDMIGTAQSSCKHGFCATWFFVFVGLLFLSLMAIIGYFLLRALRRRKAFLRGTVPAAHVLPGHKLTSEQKLLELHARCPLSKEEFAAKERECPVCLAAVQQRRRWVQLLCKHGMCRACLASIVKAKETAADCPLCRAALFRRKSEEGLELPVAPVSARLAGAACPGMGPVLALPAAMPATAAVTDQGAEVAMCSSSSRSGSGSGREYQQ